MTHRLGMAAAVLSSTFGGTAGAVTRYLSGSLDAVTMAAFRFGLAFMLLLPIALAARCRWPARRDWPAVALLGSMFFALFFILYNLALQHTTAARGAMALSTLPLVTMLVAALLRLERLTARKSLGVLIAVGGVAAALAADLGTAPPGAWRGDAIMVGATLIMALYSCWSRPFAQRSSLLGFLTSGMGVGALCVVLLAAARDGFGAVDGFRAADWIAVVYLGFFGGAAAFYLWVLALERVTPTQVTCTMTINPVAAALLATLLVGEPIGWPLVLGVAAVAAGIAVAAAEKRRAGAAG
jgi:drug/metabolite transporter (DMT)-like permease